MKKDALNQVLVLANNGKKHLSYRKADLPGKKEVGYPQALHHGL